MILHFRIISAQPQSGKKTSHTNDGLLLTEKAPAPESAGADPIFSSRVPSDIGLLSSLQGFERLEDRLQA